METFRNRTLLRMYLSHGSVSLVPLLGIGEQFVIMSDSVSVARTSRQPFIRYIIKTLMFLLKTFNIYFN